MTNEYVLHEKIAKKYVEPSLIGAYQLGILDQNKTFIPVYVGRSENCILSRILDHIVKGNTKGTHFRYKLVNNPIQAYNLECTMYHLLLNNGYTLENKYHPDKIVNSSAKCPTSGCPH